MHKNPNESLMEGTELKESVLLSVVVPVSRMANYGAQIQTWVISSVNLGIHVILVHDLSSASSGEFLKDLATKYPNLVTYCEGEFGNPGAARNRGLTEVRGEWVSFWDADDTPMPDRFLEMITKANVEGFNAVVGLYEERNFITNRVTSQPDTYGNSFSASCQIARRPGIWRMGFNWSLAKGNRFPNRDMGEDQIYLILSGLTFSRTLFFDDVVYRYSRNFPGQLTQGVHRYSSLQALFERDLGDAVMQTSKFNLLTSIIILRIWISLVRQGEGRNQIRNFKLLLQYLLRSSKPKTPDQKLKIHE